MAMLELYRVMNRARLKLNISSNKIMLHTLAEFTTPFGALA